MDWISLGLSSVAIILAVASFYYQFFYRPRAVRVLTLPLHCKHGDKTFFGICNNSKESVYVTALSVNYVIKKDGHFFLQPLDNIQMHGQSAIPPGQITEFSYQHTKPHQNYLDEIQMLVFDGQSEKRIEIVASIQIAFPNGDVFTKDFATGHYSQFKEGVTGNSVYGININLLKKDKNKNLFIEKSGK